MKLGERLGDAAFAAAAALASKATGREAKVNKVVEEGLFDIDGNLTVVQESTDPSDPAHLERGSGVLNPTLLVFRTGKTVSINNTEPKRKVTRAIVFQTP